MNYNERPVSFDLCNTRHKAARATRMKTLGDPWTKGRAISSGKVYKRLLLRKGDLGKASKSLSVKPDNKWPSNQACAHCWNAKAWALLHKYMGRASELCLPFLHFTDLHHKSQVSSSKHVCHATDRAICLCRPTKPTTASFLRSWYAAEYSSGRLAIIMRLHLSEDCFR